MIITREETGLLKSFRKHPRSRDGGWHGGVVDVMIGCTSRSTVSGNLEFLAAGRPNRTGEPRTRGQ